MKPIFSKNKDIDKTAFLNWRISKHTDIANLLNLADGFMMSSLMLAKKCLKNNNDKKADIVIFPILMNANHGIELYLKAIIWTLNKLSNLDSKADGSHNIKQIYETVRSKVKMYPGQMTLKDFDKSTNGLKNYLTELFATVKATSKSDKMDFARYPFNSKYENHFYVDELRNVEIDLENFVVRFSEIKDNLENVSDFLYYYELNQQD